MATHTVKEGNAFYEIDEECMETLRKGRRDKGAEEHLWGTKNPGRKTRTAPANKGCPGNKTISTR